MSWHIPRPTLPCKRFPYYRVQLKREIPCLVNGGGEVKICTWTKDRRSPQRGSTVNFHFRHFRASVDHGGGGVDAPETLATSPNKYIEYGPRDFDPGYLVSRVAYLHWILSTCMFLKLWNGILIKVTLTFNVQKISNSFKVIQDDYTHIFGDNRKYLVRHKIQYFVAYSFWRVHVMCYTARLLTWPEPSQHYWCLYRHRCILPERFGKKKNRLVRCIAKDVTSRHRHQWSL